MICHFSLWHWIGENRDSLLVVFTFLLFVVTLFLAIYTGKLWTSTRDMVVSAGDQMRLAREEFIASHRPRLRIRNVAFDWQTTPGAARPRVWFAIVNTGETTACNIELRVEVVFKYNDKWDAPIDRQIMGITPRFLGDIGTGDNQGCYAETAETIGVLLGSLKEGTNLGIPIMFIAGHVTYRGKMGAGYSTFFVREFDHVQNTFKPSADPEENYED